MQPISSLLNCLFLLQLCKVYAYRTSIFPRPVAESGLREAIIDLDHEDIEAAS